MTARKESKGKGEYHHTAGETGRTEKVFLSHSTARENRPRPARKNSSIQEREKARLAPGERGTAYREKETPCLAKRRI